MTNNCIALTNQMFKLEKKLSKTYEILGKQVNELERYKKGYQILIDHFDALPDDLKEKAHKDLQKEDL